MQTWDVVVKSKGEANSARRCARVRVELLGNRYKY